MHRACVGLLFGLTAASFSSFGGCGARSDLSDSAPKLAVSSHDSGVLESGVPDTSIARPPHISSCPAALLANAPTPMRGYCSTRAYRSQMPLPYSRPMIVWSTKFPLPLSYQAIEIVVDDLGYSFATVQANTQISYLAPDTIFAFDPRGQIVWTKKLDGGSPSGLFLAADGTLRFRVGDVSPPLFMVMSRDGHVVSQTPLPDKQAGDFAVGRDGSLYTNVFDTQGSISVVKLTADGALVWKSPIYPLCSLGASPIALSNDDLVVFALASSNDDCQFTTVGRLIAIHADGSPAWQHDFAADTWAIDPAVAPDGSIRIGIESDPNTHLVALHSIDTNGNTLWITSLQGDLNNVAGSPMPIGEDGAAYPRIHDGPIAISAQGAILWKFQSDSSAEYDAVTDSATLLVGHGDWTALDTANGSSRWTFNTPIEQGGIDLPFAVGKERSVVASLSSSGYSLFLAVVPVL